MDKPIIRLSFSKPVEIDQVIGASEAVASIEDEAREPPFDVEKVIFLEVRLCSTDCATAAMHRSLHDLY